MRMHRLALAAAAGLLLVCGTGWPEAEAGTSEILEGECQVQLNLSDSACTCIGEMAEADLNPKQQELVVAMVTKDEAASARLRGEMTVNEMTGAAEFMMNAPQTCAAQ